DTRELFRELLNDVQNIHEELAEYINTPSWNRPVFYDDDEDCTIAITPDFPITDSLSMGDEHLDTILATELDKFIKSSVENHIPIPKIVSDNSNADIESFSPSPIPNKDSDSNLEEIDLPFTPDDPMPPSIEDDNYDSGR
nr:hypothetical protein [Tanacetum cinerariifolium]